MVQSAPFDPFTPQQLGRGAAHEGQIQTTRNAFGDARAGLEAQRAKGVVGLPEKPEPEFNPFADPLVQIGMALQGKSAEAIQQASNIDRFNKSREDKYNADVIQHGRNRQRREDSYAQTLEGLRIEEEAKINAARNRFEDKSTQRANRIEDLERGDAAAAAQAARQNEQNRIQAEKLVLDRDRFEGGIVAQAHVLDLQDGRKTLWQESKANLPQGIVFEEGRLDANDKQVGTSLDDPSLTDDRVIELVQEAGRGIIAGLETYAHGATGYIESESAKVRAMVAATIAQHTGANAKPGGAVDIASVPPAVPEGATPIQSPEQINEQNRAQTTFSSTDVNAARDFDFTSAQDVNSFIDKFSNFLDAEEMVPFTQFQLDREKKGAFGRLTSDQGLGQEARANVTKPIEIFKRQMTAGRLKDPKFFLTGEFKGLVMGSAREIAQEEAATFASANPSQSTNSKEYREIVATVRQRLMVELDLKKGYVDDRDVTRLINQGLNPVRLASRRAGGIPPKQESN